MPHNTLSGIVPQTGDLLTEATVSASSSGDNTIVSATASQTTRVFVLQFTVSGDTDIIIKSGSTALTGTITMFAGGSATYEFQDYWWFKTGANEAFIINSSNAVTIGGLIKYQKT